MYKKSFFRGLGTGLIVGALTVTVAFNYGNAGKDGSGQGNTSNVIQQTTTEGTEESSDKADNSTTEKKTTEKAKAEKNTTEKSTTEKAGGDKTTEKASKDTDANSNSVNGKGDVYSDGSSKGNSGDSNGNAAGNDANSGSSSDGTNGSSTDGSGASNGNSTDSSGLSDKTQKVPSAKDNGYTEDKNSQSGSGSGTGKTTEATTEAQKPSAIKYDDGGGQITIVDGMSAYEICQLLEQIGLRDADEYYDWLLRSGYSNSLVSGTYTFTGNETNGGIVWILLGHQ